MSAVSYNTGCQSVGGMHMCNGYSQQYSHTYVYIYDFIRSIFLQLHFIDIINYMFLDWKVVIVVILCFNLNVYVCKDL